jgi:hypothetical protein
MRTRRSLLLKMRRFYIEREPKQIRLSPEAYDLFVNGLTPNELYHAAWLQLPGIRFKGARVIRSSKSALA